MQVGSPRIYCPSSIVLQYIQSPRSPPTGFHLHSSNRLSSSPSLCLSPGCSPSHRIRLPSTLHPPTPTHPAGLARIILGGHRKPAHWEPRVDACRDLATRPYLEVLSDGRRPQDTEAEEAIYIHTNHLGREASIPRISLCELLRRRQYKVQPLKQLAVPVARVAAVESNHRRGMDWRY